MIHHKLSLQPVSQEIDGIKLFSDILKLIAILRFSIKMIALALG